jgi:predicted Ser/Thr protein kinase
VTSEDWRELNDLFHGARDLPTGDRAAWLAEATGGNATRVAQVMELLRAADTSGTFLEQPIQIEPADLAEALSAPFESLEPGQRVKQYEVVREIGRGGMGVVYLGRDNLDRDVAMKVVPPEVSLDPSRRERLRREAIAAAKIDHPAVAKVFELAELDGHLILVSEFVRGRSLREAIEAAPMSAPRAVSVAIEIAGALSAAHTKGIVHRDLKPENILLTDQGAVKVVDFGIAYMDAEENTRFTKSGVIIGTPAYMAPEQLIGAKVDGRADIYSLGLVLGEMVAGRHPLANDGPPALPPALAAVVTRCLQPEPGARFASAEALISALRSIRSGPSDGISAALWWWAFHQGAVALAYAGLLFPAWLAREYMGGRAGMLVFLLLMASGIAAITMRLHLWFVSRQSAEDLPEQQAQTAPWLRIADGVFAAGLLGSGLFVGADRPVLAIVLSGASVIVAMAFLIIEPSTARSAFRRTTGVSAEFRVQSSAFGKPEAGSRKPEA